MRSNNKTDERWYGINNQTVGGYTILFEDPKKFYSMNIRISARSVSWNQHHTNVCVLYMKQKRMLK
jgi:hypothetical protein